MQAQLQFDKYVIKSPIAGTVLYKNIVLGQVINRGAIVGTVQQTSDYWMKIYVPQKYNGQIHVGDAMNIHVSNIEGQTVSGVVSYVSSKAEFTPKNVQTVESKQESTVFAVKLDIKDHIDELNAGMTATIEFGK